MKKYIRSISMLFILCMVTGWFSACKAIPHNPEESAESAPPLEKSGLTRQIAGTNPGFSFEIPSTWIVEDLSSVPGYVSDGEGYIRGYYYMHPPIAFPFNSEAQLTQLTLKILYEKEMSSFDKQVYTEYILDNFRKNIGVLDVLQEKLFASNYNSTIVNPLEREEINGIPYYTVTLKQTASHHVDNAYHLFYITYHEDHAFVLWIQTIDKDADLSWLKQTLGSLSFADPE